MLKMTLNVCTLKKLVIWGRTVSELQISVLHSHLLPPSAHRRVHRGAEHVPADRPLSLEDSVVKRSAPVVFVPRAGIVLFLWRLELLGFMFGAKRDSGSTNGTV